MGFQKWGWFRFVLLVPLIASSFSPAPGADESITKQTARRFRGPVALVLLDGGKTLLTANRRSGSISIVDTKTLAVTGEMAAGKKLSGLVAVPGQDWLL